MKTKRDIITITIFLFLSAFYTLLTFVATPLYAQYNYSIDPSATSSANTKGDSPTLQSETKKLTPLSEPTFVVGPSDQEEKNTKEAVPTKAPRLLNCGFPLSRCSGIVYFFLIAFAALTIFAIYKKYRTHK